VSRIEAAPNTTLLVLSKKHQRSVVDPLRNAVQFGGVYEIFGYYDPGVFDHDHKVINWVIAQTPIVPKLPCYLIDVF